MAHSKANIVQFEQSFFRIEYDGTLSWINDE